MHLFLCLFPLLATSQEDEVLPSLCCVGHSAVHCHNHRGLCQTLIWLWFPQVKPLTKSFIILCKMAGRQFRKLITVRKIYLNLHIQAWPMKIISFKGYLSSEIASLVDP